MTQIKDSLYEQLNPLTTVAGQHFVEDFSGNTLDTFRWGVATDTGGSVSMGDEINGGVALTTTTAAYSRSGIGWCPDHTGTDQYMTPLHYSQTGSVIHVISRVAGSTSYANASGFGFMEKFSDGSGRNTACMMLGAVAYFRLRTCNSSGTQTSPDTDVSTADRFTNHLWTTECRATSVDLSCNGVFKVTSTTNLPSSGLAPCCGVQNSNAGAVTTNYVTYIEAYNT